MVRAVLDTVVFVRALINPYSQSGRLLSDYTGRFTLVISKQTAQELLEVIRRPRLVARYTKLGPIDIAHVITLLSQAESVELTNSPSVVRDPKDDIFVATALVGRADYIVSEDQDLLSLGNSAGVPVINTEAFLALLSSS